MFNIKTFLKEHNIRFIESGAEVAKGNINICCPFCQEDTKFHMGINLKRQVFGCWRDETHRGKNIAYLVARLLRCSVKYAKYLVYGDDNTVIDAQNSLLKTITSKMYQTSYIEKELDIQANLNEFDTFKTIKPKTKYYSYLKGRGFDAVSLVIDKYNLKYSQIGEWSGRIIFPVYIDNELVTWQGRDITNKAFLRYKDLEKSKSKVYTKSCIYNYDNLEGNVLYICEGVFDAIKIDFYTPSEIASTCVFTKTVTQDQYKLLFNKVGNFKEVRILFDRETIKDSHRVKSQLIPFNKNVKVISLPEGIKDAGDMTKEQIIDTISR